MPFKIKNWKLAILAVLFICFFTFLGCWQVSRAKQKQALLHSFSERTALPPRAVTELNKSADWRFYRTQLQGTFDNQHTILLDNKIVDGKVGYEIYTLFHAVGLKLPILVDRGFVPLGISRQQLPVVRPIITQTTITGMLNSPPRYVAFGKMNDSPLIKYPLRVEYINLSELGKFFGTAIYPYILNVTARDPSAYAVDWQVVTITPERHMGYAVQWFALALTLLILFIALNWDRSTKVKK